MAYPDFLNLISYWTEYPPVHLSVRAFIKPKAAAGPGQLSDAEKAIMPQGKVATFGQLPRHVQQWIFEEKEAKQNGKQH